MPTPTVLRPAPRSALRVTGDCLWRAQIAHVGVFIGAPLAWALLDAALTLVRLPFTLLGPGSASIQGGKGLAHLGEPGCWLMAAPCSLAGQALAGWSGATLDWEFSVRHAWAVLALVWGTLHAARHTRPR